MPILLSKPVSNLFNTNQNENQYRHRCTINKSKKKSHVRNWRIFTCFLLFPNPSFQTLPPSLFIATSHYLQSDVPLGQGLSHLEYFQTPSRYWDTDHRFPDSEITGRTHSITWVACSEMAPRLQVWGAHSLLQELGVLLTDLVSVELLWRKGEIRMHFQGFA